jgi:hypothetical protein
MNRWVSAVRDAIAESPDGIDYAGLCQATGIARDKIGKHVQAVVAQGEAKAYIIDGAFLYKPTNGASGPHVQTAVAERPALEIPAFIKANGEFHILKEATAMGDRPPAIRTNLHELALENVIAAASHLAAAVRENVELDECPDLSRAVKQFDLAERIHEAAKA